MPMLPSVAPAAARVPAPPVTFAPGAVVANLRSLTGAPALPIVAGEALAASTTWLPTREAAFKAAYAASLGAAAGAMLIGHSSAGFSVQSALVAGADGATTPFDLESLHAGDRPVAGRGWNPALVAIIDGAAIVVPSW